MRKILVISATALIFISIFCAITPPLKSEAASNNGEITIESIPGPTVANRIEERAKASWSWYVARGSGLVAAIALVILMISGIGQVTGFTFRFLEPLTAWASHRALGITFGISVLVHMLSFLFDRFVPFNIIELLVPWLSKYKPVIIGGHSFGSLYIALGVLAFYLIAMIIITSLVWIDKKPYTWKITHLLSYFALLFVFIHALYLGTDVAHGILRIIWILIGIGCIVAILHRLWRAKTI